jgi:glycosyltransferase involved in cell wall biosynthesis
VTAVSAREPSSASDLTAADTLQVALDATPLLGARTGVGRYVEQLVNALSGELPEAQRPHLVLVPFTFRGAKHLADVAPHRPGVRTTSRRVPARALRELWARTPLPPAELLSGRVDVWHGTNFVLPPTRRAAGVVTVHDLTYLRHPQWVAPAVARYRSLVPVALRRARAVCTPSRAVRAELLEAYPWLDADRVVATPLCADPAMFGAQAPGAADRQRLGLPERYLLFLGSADPRKGLDTLFDAYRVLLARAADVPPLVIVGPPGWGPAAERSNLPEHLVRSIGYVDAAHVPPLVAGAAALVYPSRYEGFGLPPLEAFAAGVPAVVSDLPVTREVLGDLADFAPPGDAAALADVVAGVVERGPDAGRADRVAHAATFSPATLAAATLTAYGRALA